MKFQWSLIVSAMLCATSPLLADDTSAPAMPLEDHCLDGQDMNAEDVDVSNCPALPTLPEDAPFEGNDQDKVSLGAWELGTTADGEVYKYGTLSAENDAPRMLEYSDESGEVSVAVSQDNLACWAKGYYRLRKILQNPPASYKALRAAGFQYRFFQFQTDLRNGPTGFREISSYMDHLVKWVTRIDLDGTCVQPTFDKFDAYATSELIRRGITAE